MENVSRLISRIKSSALAGLLFLFPLFFLSITSEFYITNKLYLITFAALLLLLVSTVQFLISKKLVWEKTSFDLPLIVFPIALGISVLFMSPNKIQALLNPSFGLVMMVSLVILYFYISRDVRVGSSDPNMDGATSPLQILSVSSALLSIITIVFFFQPFKNINLPQFLAFLKNPGFTPVGNQLDLAVFLGFFVIIAIINLIKKGEKTSPLHSTIYHLSSIILLLLALFLTVYSLVKPAGQGNALSQLPPFRLSWFAALEVLKTPSSAFLGIGLDNFSAIFTRVKDLAYNQSPLWQINAFNVSSSAVLQIFTETGIFGIAAFGVLVFSVFKHLVRAIHESPLQLISFAYLLICLFIFPTSLIIWFLFFVMLGVVNHLAHKTRSNIDLAGLLPIYIGIVVIAFGLIGASGYFLGRSYASEYYFKKSLDGIIKNNLKEVYDSQRQAVILNPYIERFRSNFAQTNLLIANNLAQKDQKKITNNDRQTITQAIQAGIAEGKAVVSLNPQKADGWQNLASIYLNIINAAKGADAWTISAYQRAILADPQNPTYRVGLGGVYYSQKKYDDALIFFEQAISLKPDWPNANYNYAWANFQKKNYSQAVNAMQNALNLINPKLDKADYQKVQKELDEFKKMLPKEEKQATPEAK